MFFWSESKFWHCAWNALVCSSTVLNDSDREDNMLRVELVLASRASRWSRDSWSCSEYNLVLKLAAIHATL